MAVPAVIGVAAIAALYTGKRYFQGPKCNSKSSLEGKPWLSQVETLASVKKPQWI